MNFRWTAEFILLPPLCRSDRLHSLCSEAAVKLLTLNEPLNFL